MSLLIDAFSKITGKKNLTNDPMEAFKLGYILGRNDERDNPRIKERVITTFEMEVLIDDLFVRGCEREIKETAQRLSVDVNPLFLYTPKGSFGDKVYKLTILGKTDNIRLFARAMNNKYDILNKDKVQHALWG